MATLSRGKIPKEKQIAVLASLVVLPGAYGDGC